MIEETDETKLDQFKKDTCLDFDLTQEQRDKANEDMRFCNVDGGMWEDWLEAAYADKARLEFDITSDYVNRYVGEWTQNRANVFFAPDDDSTEEDDAELLTGIYRDDFREHDGELSQDNAVLEVAQCGVGAFKISTQYEDEEDIENDQQTAIFEPIYNAFNHVIWDANAKRIDKLDAKRCTVLTPYNKDTFKAEYPDAKEVSAFTPNNRSSFNWATNDLIYVAERYEVKTKKDVVYVYQNIEEDSIKRLYKKDAEKAASELAEQGYEKVREKKVIRRYVEKSIFNGVEFLEESKKIAGQFIPVIPMYGYRTFIDGAEYYRGLVRKLKDANRLFNMNVSRMAESASTSGDTIPIFTADQISGLEALWADKTNKAYMLVNDLEDADGNRIPSEPVGYLQPNQVDPNTIATTEIVSNFAQRLTGNAPQDQVDPDASGVAIAKLKKRENLNTQIISDNILTALKHSGRVYRSIAAEIYDETRSKSTLAEDGTMNRVQLQQPVMDQETGTLKKINDISKGKFKVIVDVGVQFESEREATVESLEAVIEKVGESSPYFAPLMAMWMENITGTGLKPLKEFNRKQMLKLALIEPENDEEKQLVAQLSQQISPQDQLTQAAAKQQEAEATNLIASSQQKQADAALKKAQTAEKVIDIGIKRAEQMAQRFQSLPAQV